MVNTPTPVTPNPNGDPQSMEKLKQSAGYIGGIIVLALVGYFGWTYYQGAGVAVDTVAADKYVAIEASAEAMRANQESIDAETRKAIEADIDALVAEHGQTIYAWEALMLKARIATDADDFETAKQALKTALGIELNDAGLHSIAQLRYATALLANGDVDEAMTQASTEMPLSFEGSQQELLGDIYMAKEDKENAINAYQNAWSLLSKRGEERGILRLKLEGLGITPEPVDTGPQIIDQPTESDMVASLENAQVATADDAETNESSDEAGVDDQANLDNEANSNDEASSDDRANPDDEAIVDAESTDTEVAE